jgi:hypothetical protein
MKKRLKNKPNLGKKRLKEVNFFSKKQTIFTISIYGSWIFLVQIDHEGTAKN